MSAADRVSKFYDDQATILPTAFASIKGGSKVSSEITKFGSWLVKHQNEAVADGSKGKILQILEKYNRAAQAMFNIRKSVISLFQIYLALPEGKLVTSKNKASILVWLENLERAEDIDDCATTPNAVFAIEMWDVAAIDDNGRMCLLKGEQVQEDVVVEEKMLLDQISNFYNSDDGCSVLVSIDPNNNGNVIIIEAFKGDE